jgi:GNAT superfamily N-acetyltransferase
MSNDGWEDAEGWETANDGWEDAPVKKGRGRQFVDDTKGTLAAVGDLVGSIPKFAVQVGAASIGKVMRPDMSLKELYDAAGKEVESKVPSIGSQLEDKTAYNTINKPFEWYDEYAVQPVAEFAGKHAGKDAQGAAEILMNVLPVPPVVKAAQMVKKNWKGKTPEVPQRDNVADVFDEADAPPPETVEAPPADVYNVAPDGTAFPPEVQPAYDLHRANQPKPTVTPEQGTLPLQTTVEQIAAKRNAEAGQFDLFDNEARNQPMSQNVPGPSITEQVNLRKEQDYNASVARTQQYQHQMEIDPTPYGDPPANYGSTPEFGRIDENGIPIRADLSMEAQNLENPLQRNFWGDELPGKTGDGGIPLTRAIDKMEPAARAEAIRSQFMEPPSIPLNGGMGRGQRGAINPKVLVWADTPIKKALDRLGERFKGWTMEVQTSPYGPEITIRDHEGQQAGSLYTKVNGDNLEVGRVAVKTEHQGQGLAKLMYESILRTGNDIVRSESQLPDGKAMWDHWEKTGYAKGGVLRSPGNKQGGGVDFDAISNGLKGIFTGKKTPKTDNVVNPTSPENIAKKAELRAKAKAVKADSPYRRVSTVEEALADPGKDIMNNPVRDALKPGSEATLRSNSSNNVINFVRTKAQEGRLMASNLSKKWVTGKDGISPLLKSLNDKEKAYVARVLQEASRRKRGIDDAMIAKLGLNDKQAKLVKRLREIFDERYALVQKNLGEQGLEGFKYENGYMPSVFTGAYTSLVGVKGKDGQFRIKAVAQGDSRAQMHAAIEYYKKQGLTEVIKLPRKGLKTSTWNYNRTFNGFNDLVAEIAKRDPDFADLKRAADVHAADQIRGWMRMDLHERQKAGVRGADGDRPWLSEKQNTNDFFESMVQFLEDAANYDSMMGPLNDFGKLTSDPGLQSTHGNTVKWVDKYVKHITGQNLNPAGALGNWIIDGVPAIFGQSYKPIAKGSDVLRTAMTAHMMGLWNIGFFQAQLTQVITGGVPEAMDIKSDLGLSANDVTGSLSKVMFELPQLYLEAHLGKKANVSPESRAAHDWAHDNGLFDFSEIELAKDVMKSDTRKAIESGATVPLWLGEQMTRPVVFMWYANMMHKAGFKGEDAFTRAHTATQYAMADYHPHERAPIYQSLGVLGQFMGGLTTYKHNTMDQWFTRAENAVTKGKVAPLAAMLATGYLLYGVSGLPGYDEADASSRAMTGHSLRQHVLEGDDPSAVWDGLLSAKTGLDFQSRLSMASIIPDTTLGAVSPHLSNAWRIVHDSFQAAVNQDPAAVNKALYSATPAGLRGMTEELTRTDEEGWVYDAEGKTRTEEPRTQREREIRAVTGIRPLRERLNDESMWADTQRNKSVEDQLSDLSKRMKAAVRHGDQDAYDKMFEEYQDLGGDPRTVSGSAFYKEALVEGNKTPRERAGGKPTGNLNTIRRYEEFNR